MRHRRRQAALELVVVVGVEQIVLAVVLVVHHRLDLLQAVLEEPLRRLTAGTRAVGIAAPGEVGLGEVRRLLPATLVDQRLLAGPVGARPGAEDAEAGAPPGLVLRSEEHTSELQSLMRNSYAVLCLKKQI